MDQTTLIVNVVMIGCAAAVGAVLHRVYGVNLILAVALGFLIAMAALGLFAFVAAQVRNSESDEGDDTNAP